MAHHPDLIARFLALPVTLGIGAVWSTLRKKEGRERIASALKGFADLLANSSFTDKLVWAGKWGLIAVLLFGFYQSIRSDGFRAGRDYQARVCFQLPGSDACLRNAPYEGG